MRKYMNEDFNKIAEYLYVREIIFTHDAENGRNKQIREDAKTRLHQIQQVYDDMERFETKWSRLLDVDTVLKEKALYGGFDQKFNSHCFNLVWDGLWRNMHLLEWIEGKNKAERRARMIAWDECNMLKMFMEHNDTQAQEVA